MQFFFRTGILSTWLVLLTGCTCLFSQQANFSSFISRLSDNYNVHVALAPELIPALDSLRYSGHDIQSIQALLELLLKESGISYQIVDGDKIMLRREDPVRNIHGSIILKGNVLDKNSGEPLAFASIAGAGGHGCIADENGHFLLSVSDSNEIITIYYLGNAVQSIPARKLLTGETRIQMEVLKIPLREVIIVVPAKSMEPDYSDQSIELSGYQFISEEELLTWNSERLLTSLTSYTQFSAEEGILIRGSDESHSLIMMDEIPVYDPYHFYNLFAPFNGHHFTSVEVYKNNFPVAYGGRIDGLILANSQREQPASRLLFDTDLLLTSLSTEIKVSPQIVLTASGRISHTAMLNDEFQDSTVTNFSLPGRFKDENEWTTTEQPQSDFYDINLGASIQTGEESYLRLNYFNSHDELDNLTGTSFETTIFNHEVASVEQSYASADLCKNHGWSADYSTKLTDFNSLQLTAWQSGLDKKVDYTSMFHETRPHMERWGSFEGFQQSELTTFGTRGSLQHQFRNASGYTFGVEFQIHQTDVSAKENNTPYLTQAQK